MLESLSQNVLGLVCAQLGSSVFSSVTTRRNFTDRGITELILESNSDTHSSEDEEISVQSDSDTGDNTIDTNFTQWTDNTNCPTVPIMHKFTGGPSGLQQTGTHNNKDSSSPSIFMFFFFQIIQLLVEETNRYYHQYLDTLDEWQSPLPYMTVQKMCLFLVIIVQVRHDQRDMLKDYLSTLEQYFVAFYGNTMKQDRFYHILRFLHMSDKKNEADKKDVNYD